MNSTQTSILIVEDEKNLGLTLQEYLQSKGYKIFWAQNAMEAKEYFELIPKSPQGKLIVLMDIGLPDGHGLELGKQFKEKRDDVMLLFLSALNDPIIKVAGLELGAEDYITKPFDLKELMLRLKRIFKSFTLKNQLPEEICHGPLIIRPGQFQLVDAHKNVLNLGQKECSILLYLYQNRNKVVDRDDIINTIWPSHQEPSNRTVDNYIVRFRKWCDTDKDRHLEIQSIRGIGYKLQVRE